MKDWILALSHVTLLTLLLTSKNWCTDWCWTPFPPLWQKNLTPPIFTGWEIEDKLPFRFTVMEPKSPCFRYEVNERLASSSVLPTQSNGKIKVAPASAKKGINYLPVRAHWHYHAGKLDSHSMLLCGVVALNSPFNPAEIMRRGKCVYFLSVFYWNRIVIAKVFCY